MFDDDFNELAWSLGGIGGGVLATLVVLGILLFAGYALENHQVCAELTCPSGQAAELLHHECTCVTPLP